MSRGERERLADILSACEAIADHLKRIELGEGLVFDAIRIRLVEIGEAVKDLDVTTTAAFPELPWSEIARMRDLLTHRCFDTDHSIVFTSARVDVPLLAEVVGRMFGALES